MQFKTHIDVLGTKVFTGRVERQWAGPRLHRVAYPGPSHPLVHTEVVPNVSDHFWRVPIKPSGQLWRVIVHVHCGTKRLLHSPIMPVIIASGKCGIDPWGGGGV